MAGRHSAAAPLWHKVALATSLLALGFAIWLKSAQVPTSTTTPRVISSDALAASSAQLATTTPSPTKTTLKPSPTLPPGATVIKGVVEVPTTTVPPAPVTTVAAPPPPAPPVSNPSLGQQALNWATTQLGQPYVWGGNGPDVNGGWDCSGLMKWAWGKVGYTLDRTSEAQAYDGWEVSYANRQPGDLMFTNYGQSGPGHVVMYAGWVKGIGDAIIEAQQPGVGVVYSPISIYSYGSIRRIA